jgi:hypothetical protein
MFPSLGLLSGILTGVVAKLSIAGLDKYGYLPQSTYVNRALKALEKDDLDEAIRNFQLARGRKRSTTTTEIAHEVISQAIVIRIVKLEVRVDEIEEALNPPFLSIEYWRNLLPRQRPHLESLRAEQAGFREAIAVLNKIKDQLTEGA